VLDTRGFELEITADNILDLATTSTIVRGEIIDDCVWAMAGKVYLCSTNHPEYVYYKSIYKNKDAVTKITPGGYYTAVNNGVSIFRFEGLFYVTHLDVENRATKGSYTINRTSGGLYNSYSLYEALVEEYETVVRIQSNCESKKPLYVYTEFSVDSEGDVTKNTVHVRSGHFKKLVDYSGVVTKDMNEHKFDRFHWLNRRQEYAYEERDKFDRIEMNKFLGNFAFFNTREDAKKFDYTTTIDALKFNINKLNVDKIVGESRKSNYGYYHNDRFDISVTPDAKRIKTIFDNR
jgi:hypothetical protein